MGVNLTGGTRFSPRIGETGMVHGWRDTRVEVRTLAPKLKRRELRSRLHGLCTIATVHSVCMLLSLL